MPVCVILSIDEHKLEKKHLSVSDLKLEEKYMSDESVKSTPNIVSEEDFKRLEQRKKILVEQYFFDRLDYDEIGYINGLSPKVVEVWISESLNTLLHYVKYPEVTRQMIEKTPLDQIKLPSLRHLKLLFGPLLHPQVRP